MWFLNGNSTVIAKVLRNPQNPHIRQYNKGLGIPSSLGVFYGRRSRQVFVLVVPPPRQTRRRSDVHPETQNAPRPATVVQKPLHDTESKLSLLIQIHAHKCLRIHRRTPCLLCYFCGKCVSFQRVHFSLQKPRTGALKLLHIRCLNE